jgi:hypothetical protein
VTISSVSRAVALVTTPTIPRLFQARMLFEPIEPTSAALRVVEDERGPGPQQVLEGLRREPRCTTRPPTWSYSSTGRFPALPRWVGT